MAELRALHMSGGVYQFLTPYNILADDGFKLRCLKTAENTEPLPPWRFLAPELRRASEEQITTPVISTSKSRSIAKTKERGRVVSFAIEGECAAGSNEMQALKEASPADATPITTPVPVSSAADIYSLGQVVLWLSCLGRVCSLPEALMTSLAEISVLNDMLSDDPLKRPDINYLFECKWFGFELKASTDVNDLNSDDAQSKEEAALITTVDDIHNYQRKPDIIKSEVHKMCEVSLSDAHDNAAYAIERELKNISPTKGQEAKMKAEEEAILQEMESDDEIFIENDDTISKIICVEKESRAVSPSTVQFDETNDGSVQSRSFDEVINQSIQHTETPFTKMPELILQSEEVSPSSKLGVILSPGFGKMVSQLDTFELNDDELSVFSCSTTCSSSSDNIDPAEEINEKLKMTEKESNLRAKHQTVYNPSLNQAQEQIEHDQMTKDVVADILHQDINLTNYSTLDNVKHHNGLLTNSKLQFKNAQTLNSVESEKCVTNSHGCYSTKADNDQLASTPHNTNSGERNGIPLKPVMYHNIRSGARFLSKTSSTHTSMPLHEKNNSDHPLNISYDGDHPDNSNSQTSANTIHASNKSRFSLFRSEAARNCKYDKHLNFTSHQTAVTPLGGNKIKSSPQHDTRNLSTPTHHNIVTNELQFQLQQQDITQSDKFLDMTEHDKSIRDLQPSKTPPVSVDFDKTIPNLFDRFALTSENSKYMISSPIQNESISVTPGSVHRLLTARKSCATSPIVSRRAHLSKMFKSHKFSTESRLSLTHVDRLHTDAPTPVVGRAKPSPQQYLYNHPSVAAHSPSQELQATPDREMLQHAGASFEGQCQDETGPDEILLILDGL